MSSGETLSFVLGPAQGVDTAKRQQIMDGARAVFLEKGFDGASINDIVRRAGVSKGTVYAYFASKEILFERMILEDRREQSEQLFDLACAPGKSPVEILTDIGFRLVSMMIKPAHVAYARMVISAAGKFPEAGQAYFEAGPEFIIQRIAGYLASLGLENPERAAQQFVDLCASSCVRPLLFGVEREFTEAQLRAQASAAARMILSFSAAR